MHASRELIDQGALPAKIENANFRIRDTLQHSEYNVGVVGGAEKLITYAVEAALGIGLVFACGFVSNGSIRGFWKHTYNSDSIEQACVPF